MKHQDQTIPKGWYSKDGYHWCDNGGPSIDISTGDAVVLVITRKVDDGEGDGVFMPLKVFDRLCEGWVSAPSPLDPGWYCEDRYHWDDGTRSIDIEADLVVVVTTRGKIGHSVSMPDDEFGRLCRGWLDRRREETP